MPFPGAARVIGSMNMATEPTRNAGCGVDPSVSPEDLQAIEAMPEGYGSAEYDAEREAAAQREGVDP